MKFLVKLSYGSYSLYCSFEDFNHIFEVICYFNNLVKSLKKNRLISFNFKVLENVSIYFKKCLKMKGFLLIKSA